MRPPAFWQEPRPNGVARLLQPVGWLYGMVTAARMRTSGWQAPVPVICVGNLTLGGTGKTPTALMLADMLEARGRRPAFLSRGYGGTVSEARMVQRDDCARLVGDEPLLLAARAPTIVAADRAAGARLALSEGADVLVMDDGLQNPTLAKSLTIAVIDGGVGFGNGLVFPAGPLRARVSDQAAHVDLSLIVGAGEAGARAAGVLGKPMLEGCLLPDPEVAERLRGRRVAALVGVGRPAKVLETIASCGATVAHALILGDHEAASASALAALAGKARADAMPIVTTTKDYARLDAGDRQALADLLVVLPVRLTLAPDSRERLDKALTRILSA
jgi:tetraacyldisaccharide 4'-kinase